MGVRVRIAGRQCDGYAEDHGPLEVRIDGVQLGEAFGEQPAASPSRSPSVLAPVRRWRTSRRQHQRWLLQRRGRRRRPAADRVPALITAESADPALALAALRMAVQDGSRAESASTRLV